MDKKFNGKAIYNPSGKAQEYSYWACNFYNGCSAKCDYCYNRHGITAKILGQDTPVLKKCLQNPDSSWEIPYEFALGQFMDEVDKNIDELRKYGLFFNFVSDPFLHETIELNTKAMAYCVIKDVPVKLLTKQTWWINEEKYTKFLLYKHNNIPYKIAFGFTLTGHDELEPGANTNMERIEVMKKLNDLGLKTFASIEPIIDLQSSFEMIVASSSVNCNLIKVGLQSGKKYDKKELLFFVERTIKESTCPIYFKDSLLKQAEINRIDLPSNCVNRDYNLFN